MTPLFWNPDEANSGAYKPVEKHSDGMISFSYRPPSKADVDALKNTETYRRLIEEGGGASLGVTPSEKEPADEG
jgi:hypothetical protein